MKSKKHAVTLNRTTKDLEIKTDTIRLVKCIWTQPADVVRTTIKKVLDTFGYDSSNWKVNATTDGEPTMVADHAIGRFQSVGLYTNLVGTFVDHTLHLDVEDTLGSVKKLEDAIKKV